jgi:hypothetical protein
MSGAPTPRPETRGRLARTRWRRCSQVMSCVLRRHTPSGKRHASCGGFARACAYGLEADWRPGRRRRPAERERRRRQRQTRRDNILHNMTAPGRGVATRALQSPDLPPLPLSRPRPTYILRCWVGEGQSLTHTVSHAEQAASDCGAKRLLTASQRDDIGSDVYI